jgi:glucose/arabinose dehydrogenase
LRASAVLLVALVAFGAPLRADPTADAARRAAFVAAQADVVGAAAALQSGDAATALARLDAAVAALPPGAQRRAFVRARAAVAANGSDADATRAVRALAPAATAVRAALRRFGRRGADGPVLVEWTGSRASIRAPGARVVYRVLGADAPTLVVVNDDATAVHPDVVALPKGRFRVTWGADVGAATLAADGASLRAFNVGPRGVLALAPPTAPGYGAATKFGRVGAPLDVAAPSVAGAGPLAFSVDPPFTDGLVFDAATGAFSGTPTTSGPATTHRVTVRNARAAAAADVVVDVDPALPAQVHDLAGGFAVEAVAQVPGVPARIAPTPDGRLLVNELTTGKIRVIAADGTLLAEPMATVDAYFGPEQGLLGIAVAPNFATSGRVYVVASAAAEAGHADRNRILRYTATGDVASGPEILVDDLPLGTSQNGGALCFGNDGMLYATVGDTNVPELAQAEGSLAGRVLRIAPDGGVPADNPFPGSYEFCRGFRNAFGICVDRRTGFLFATENGPAAHDELDFVQAMNNYGWGAPDDAHFGAYTGIRVFDWATVIVPTGVACHDGLSFGPAYAGNLFLGSYDRGHVRRIVLEGVDLRAQTTFVQFDEFDFQQKPLDVAEAPDGALWVSTFSTVWRVRRD